MRERILVLYGSYRSDRMGIPLARFIVAALRDRGADVELIDAKAVGLPLLDRMYKEFAPGTAPGAMQELAAKIKGADAFVFVTGEYNWGMQPGLKNLTDHFLEEWFWRPAAIASYSAGRLSGARSATDARSATSAGAGSATGARSNSAPPTRARWRRCGGCGRRAYRSSPSSSPAGPPSSLSSAG